MLVDTHAHLYWDSYKDAFDEVIKRCLDAGVNTIINVGVDVQLSKKAAEQVEKVLSKIPGLSAYSTIGIHPHEFVKYNSIVSIHKDIEELEKIYQSLPDQTIAIGECGLDFAFDRLEELKGLEEKEIKEKQKLLFQAQIDLAKKLNLPLIVHSRDDRSKDPESSEAWDKVLKMVGTHPAILHCYSGLLPTTNYILHTTNLLVSFAGTITYPKNEYLREAARLLPLEKIVLETDCPFLPPQSKRGTRNEPANILEIAQLIAEIKGISLDEVASQTTANFACFMKLNSFNSSLQLSLNNLEPKIPH